MDCMGQALRVEPSILGIAEWSQVVGCWQIGGSLIIDRWGMGSYAATLAMLFWSVDLV